MEDFTGNILCIGTGVITLLNADGSHQTRSINKGVATDKIKAGDHVKVVGDPVTSITPVVEKKTEKPVK